MCNRYQIFSSKETILQEIGHHYSQGTVPLSQFGQKDWLKRLAYTKIAQKLKIVKNGSGSFLWNFLKPLADSFKERNFSLINWSPFRRTYSSLEPILAKESVMRSKRLDYTKIPQETRNWSKMIGGALFGTFCSRYQIFSSKETVL